MTELDLIRTVPLLQLVAVGLYSDFRSQTIPNGITLGGAAFALILQTTVFGMPGLIQGAGGWVLCLAVLLPFYVGGGMAAGDVKLMAMVGAFLGPLSGLLAVLLTLIAGAVIGLLCVAYQQLVQHFDAPSGEPPFGLRRQLQSRIPYAGAIAAGTALAVFGADMLIPVVL